MEIIKHRVNSKNELKDVATHFGVEIDLRSNGETLILNHDPYSHGSETFENWLADYKHGTLVVNIKEEGLEVKARYYLEQANVDRYFFLDQSFPFLVRSLVGREKGVSARVSEFESTHTVLNLINNDMCPEWVWVDSFLGDWSHFSSLELLKDFGIKLCLVSPELQGRLLQEELPGNSYLADDQIFDAVCTKNPDFWQGFLDG